MDKKENYIGTVVVVAVIAVIIAFFVGYSYGNSSSNTTAASTSDTSDESTYTESEYQEAVDCVKEANDKLDNISSDAGSVGDGDDYGDLVSVLGDLQSQAEDTVCTNLY